MTHAQKIHCGGEQIKASEWQFAGSKALQIVAKTRVGSLPAEANFVDVIDGDASELEASVNCVVREITVMFNAANPLFGDGEEELSIAD